MQKLWASALLLASLCAADLAAQDAELVPGARVRITQVEAHTASARPERHGTLTGTLVEADSTSFTVLVKGTNLLIPRAAIARIDVSQGHASGDALQGARRGAATAASTYALLALIGLVTSSGGECEGDCPADNFAKFPLYLGGFAVVGAGLGALVGSVPRESWVPVWPPSRSVSLSVDPVPAGGTGVRVSLRF